MEEQKQSTGKKKMSPQKIVLIIVAAIVVCALLGIIFGQNGTNDTATIESLAWQDSADVELDAGDTIKNWVNISPKEFEEGDVTFVSEDEQVAVITAGTQTYGALWYEIKGVAPGETNIYAQSSDGVTKSIPIKVKVIDDEASSAIETSSVPESSMMESSMAESSVTEPSIAESSTEEQISPIEQTEQPSVSKAEPQRQPQQEPEQETVANPDDSVTVYTTPTGKRYHSDKECAGKNARATTLSDAKSRGLTPCGTCVE